MPVKHLDVKCVNCEEDIEKLPPFYVDQLLWGTKSCPKTYGYLGFVRGDGFYLKMVCEEKDPLRRYTKDNDPVYRDSAVEAFLQFEPMRGRNVLPTYLNLEMNANGALIAGYGKERIYRSYFSKEMHDSFRCRAAIEPDQWSVKLRIPIEVLEYVYGPQELDVGSTFDCNFYKISEDRDIEHYASCSPIESRVPSFHLPEFFAAAKIIL